MFEAKKKTDHRQYSYGVTVINWAFSINSARHRNCGIPGVRHLDGVVINSPHAEQEGRKEGLSQKVARRFQWMCCVVLDVLLSSEVGPTSSLTTLPCHRTRNIQYIITRVQPSIHLLIENDHKGHTLG